MKRIQELDALRGFALFGIIVVNILVFHAPYFHYGEFYLEFKATQATIIHVIVEYFGGKFLFIFAFLFGYGIDLQLKSKGEYFNFYFTNRMFVLFLFGLIHILLFWFGDILASYAILGIISLPFLKLKKRYILLLSGFFLFFRALYYLGTVYLDFPLINYDEIPTLDQFIYVFQHGNYIEIFQLRLKEFEWFFQENLIWYVSKSFGLFLLGIYASRISIFDQMRSHRLSFFMLSIVFLCLSVFWIYTKAEFFASFNLKDEPIWRPFLIALNVAFETLQGIGYIIFFSILFQTFKSLFSIFAKAGRLALTNYFLQSFICVVVFYGYGLGFYGRLAPITLLLMAVMIFVFNCLFSVFYLKYYKIGPLESIWRKFSKL